MALRQRRVHPRQEGDPLTFIDLLRHLNDPFLLTLKWEDGIKDCADGTDENIFVMSWWMLFLITLVTAVAGIALSFCCRLEVL